MVLLRANNNSDLRSVDFKTKKRLAASPYVLTQQVADAADWLPARIVSRQRTLGDLALKAWGFLGKPSSSEFPHRDPHDPHDMDRVADHVGGALLAFGPRG
jgi:hypothetical protein